MEPVIGITELGDGEMIAREVNGVSVLVCRVEGQFYATSNICSHASQRLDQGRLKGYEIVCPLHGARFDIRSGKCLAAPASAPIKTFPVTLEAGKVHVRVSADDRPRRPKFGPLY
jgi:nitrite reductase/ring-hydroxylating ferredoxin subunit